MRRSLLVFGCGGHGKVVADTALAAGIEVVGFADDDPDMRTRVTLGLPTVAIGVDEAAAFCKKNGTDFILAIGRNRQRAAVFNRAAELGLRMAIVVHPSAVVAPSVTLGAGTVVFARAVIQADTRIGDDVIVNTAASLDHDNLIGAHAHISPGAVIGGTVSIGEGTHVGIGAGVRNNLSIGAWSVIGIGAAVVRDVPGGVVAYGVPARVVRRNEAPPVR